VTAFLSIDTDTATLVAIALGAVSVVLLVVLAIVVRRLRASRRDLHSTAGVDGPANPNEIHVFRNALAREVAVAQRHERRLGLLAFDLVGLGEITDVPDLGPDAGDIVLRAVDGLTRKTVRRSDIACRKGAGEFLVILTESGLDGAEEVYRRLRHGLADLRVEYGGQVLSPVGASAGAVELRRDEDAESLFDRADEALDRARNWGGGRIAWGLDDRIEPPTEAAYGPANNGQACSGCQEFRPGTRVSGYCERWHAPIDPQGVCSAFESKRS
jgi:diguanylate cyclase (GGDEF)-like protein